MSCLRLWGLRAFTDQSKILLDVQAVKACLLDLPEPHPESGSNM